MEINDDLLEMHISDALMRIRRDYERTDGQIYYHSQVVKTQPCLLN